MWTGRSNQKLPCLLLVLAIWTVCFRFVWAALPFGIQSDDGDVASTFATAMVYDPLIERLYITGSSYGGFFDSGYSHRTKLGNRDCFLASLQLPTEADKRGPLWLLKKSYGDSNASEACTDVHLYRRDNGRSYYVTGHSIGSAGVLEDMLRGSIADNKTVEFDESEGQIGMILDSSTAGRLERGLLLRSEAIQIPFSIVSPLDESDDIIVATIYSNDSQFLSQYCDWMESQHTLQPNPDVRSAITTSIQGVAYHTSLERLSSVSRTVESQDHNGLKRSLKPLWETRFESNKKGHFVASTVHVATKDTLLLVGHTSYGALKGTQHSTVGTVKRINAQTGEEIQSIDLHDSTNSSIDRTFASCGFASSRHAFIVGGSNDFTRTTLSKLDINSMQIVWRKSLRALAPHQSNRSTAHIFGLGCVVEPNGANVYLAGTVMDGAEISADDGATSTESAGGHDIFLAKMDTKKGETSWLQQIGTSDDDSLAMQRGILLDKEHNIILLGNTKGSFMRSKNSLGVGITNDVVVFSIEKESGDCLPVIDPPGGRSPQEAEEQRDWNAGFASQLTQPPSPGANVHQGIDQLRPLPEHIDWAYPTSAPPVRHEDESMSEGLLLIAIIVVAILLLVSFLGLMYMRWCKEDSSRIASRKDWSDVNGSRQCDQAYFAGEMSNLGGSLMKRASFERTTGLDALLDFEPDAGNDRFRPMGSDTTGIWNASSRWSEAD